MGSAFSQWDVDGNGTVNQDDVTYELTSTAVGMKTDYGDANLDHKVNFTDFQVLLDHWQGTGASLGRRRLHRQPGRQLRRLPEAAGLLEPVRL